MERYKMVNESFGLIPSGLLPTAHYPLTTVLFYRSRKMILSIIKECKVIDKLYFCDR